MNKKYLLILLAVFLLAGIVFLLGGSEDRWICQDGQWVKHGVPSDSMPTKSCE